MNHASARGLQEQILRQALDILCGDPRVLAVYALGSYTRGENDAFSDIDLGCILRDEERSGRVELYERVGEISPLLCRMWIYDLNALYLYENGVRLDLDFHPPSRLAEVAGYASFNLTILHDPDGALAQALQQPHEPFHPEHPKWFKPGEQAYLDWYAWEWRQIACWTLRGAQKGKHAFSKLYHAAKSLADVRAGLTEMRLWTLDRSAYLEDADPECAGRIAGTYPRLEPGEILACTHHLLDEYARICPDYCRKAGLPYPARQVEVTRRLLAEFEAIE
jgi:predicted nucleotidyltransferase